jgi:hypothetical protein
VSPACISLLLGSLAVDEPVLPVAVDARFVAVAGISIGGGLGCGAGAAGSRLEARESGRRVEETILEEIVSRGFGRAAALGIGGITYALAASDKLSSET